MSGSGRLSEVDYVIPDEGGEGNWIAINPHLDYPDACPIPTRAGNTSTAESIRTMINGTNTPVEVAPDGWAVEVRR